MNKLFCKIMNFYSEISIKRDKILFKKVYKVSFCHKISVFILYNVHI